jgi:hypothetical protein
MAKIAGGELEVNTRDCHFGMRVKQVVWGDTPNGDQVSGNTLTFGVNPGSTPFVHPKHVQRILGGTCSTIATSYNNCAKNAYADTADECEDAPEYCLQSDFHDQP